MRIILINVVSLDGRFTKWDLDNIYEWSSPEDFKFFQKTKLENNLLVMGSGTFDQVKNIEKAGLKPEKNRLRVVMTKNPLKYKSFTVPGQLEFTSETPKKLVERLGKLKFKQMLLVGGGKIANSFFSDKLVDELWLTLEPRIFGSGKVLASGKKLNISLKLNSMEKLNPSGTLLLKYNVVK